jgi:hypothetical protein
MRVFVLCTGRCGSTTFSRACRHATNFTSGHESRVRRVGSDRLEYPPQHIEVDNRLSWFLGRLDAKYGDEALFVHLVRDSAATVDSFLRRFDRSSIMRGYAHGILMGTDAEPIDICRDYVETVNANIAFFLRSKDPSRVMTVRLEHVKEDFARFWNWIGAEGDAEAALREWDTRYRQDPAVPAVGRSPAPPEAPNLLVATRFGLGIRDQRWFDHRLQLIEAVTAPSLASQTRQDFTWAVFVDPDLKRSIRAELERIIAPAGHPVVVDTAPYNAKSVLGLAKKLKLPRHGYGLTARIDDDDAWRRDTVEKVSGIATTWLQRHHEERRPGAAITFAHGLEWIMYDAIDIDKMVQHQHVVRPQSLRPYTNPFHSMSVFVLANLTTRIAATSGKHSEMASTLSQQGFDILVQEDPDMWLYVRHKQVVSSLQKARGSSQAIDVSQLEQHFGINGNLVATYIANANEHGYAVEKRTVWRRTDLTRKLRQVDKRLAESNLPSAEQAELSRQRDDLLEELARISENLIAPIGP